MAGDKLFATEAELCTAFTKWARDRGWTVWPEWQGFDLLIQTPDGPQIGIEAKLVMNLTVVMQALPKWHQLQEQWGSMDGPDHRAILVPHADERFVTLAEMLGLAVFEVRGVYQRGDGRREVMGFRNAAGTAMFDWCPTKREPAPPYAFDVPAGVPAPTRLTPWKLAAMKVIAHLELVGSIHRKEIGAYGCGVTSFCGPRGWLRPLGEGRWARDTLPAFEAKHPDIYPKIRSEVRSQLGLSGRRANRGKR